MLIKKGLIADINVRNIEIKTELISTKNINARPGYVLNPEFITVHNTGDPGASADALSRYVRSQTGYKSWHFTVGNGVVIQQLPITESGWHAGDGASGPGNRKTIGIEICEIDGAERTAIVFIAELLKSLNMDISRVTTHNHWSGKYCPRLLLPHWNTFISNIKKSMEPYSDISGRWSEAQIREAILDGIFTGFPDGTFRPEQPLTREQAAVLYCRLKGLS